MNHRLYPPALDTEIHPLLAGVATLPIYMGHTERLHFRVRADTEARLRAAAKLEHQSLTEFVLSAAEERAESVLSQQTTLPADFFDEMFNALSEPPHPNEAMRRVARSPRVSRHS